MDKIINLKLFTIPNIIAIGAIVFFWGCAVYAVAENASNGQ